MAHLQLLRCGLLGLACVLDPLLELPADAAVLLLSLNRRRPVKLRADPNLDRGAVLDLSHIAAFLGSGAWSVTGPCYGCSVKREQGTFQPLTQMHAPLRVHLIDDRA